MDEKEIDTRYDHNQRERLEQYQTKAMAPDVIYYIDQQIGVLQREIRTLEELKKTFQLMPEKVKDIFTPPVVYFLNQKR